MKVSRVSSSSDSSSILTSPESGFARNVEFCLILSSSGRTYNLRVLLIALPTLAMLVACEHAGTIQWYFVYSSIARNIRTRRTMKQSHFKNFCYIYRSKIASQIESTQFNANIPTVSDGYRKSNLGRFLDTRTLTFTDITTVLVL